MLQPDYLRLRRLKARAQLLTKSRQLIIVEGPIGQKRPRSLEASMFHMVIWKEEQQQGDASSTHYGGKQCGVHVSPHPVNQVNTLSHSYDLFPQ